MGIEILLTTQRRSSRSGKVLVRAGESDRAVVTATVYREFEVGRARTAADGTFSIADLPEGTYTIVASFNRGAVADSLPVTVPAGAKDVVLDLTSR